MARAGQTVLGRVILHEPHRSPLRCSAAVAVAMSGERPASFSYAGRAVVKNQRRMVGSSILVWRIATLLMGTVPIASVVIPVAPTAM
jgi:hypothetical protein